MSNAIYKVMFSGQIAPDASIEEVKGKLSTALGMTAEQVEELFSGDTYSVKESTDLQTCQEIQATFEQAGAVCSIDEVSTENNDAPQGLDDQNTPAEEPVSDTISDEDQLACSSCGGMFAPDDLIEYEGARICAACKPNFVQRLQEGAPATGSALSGEHGSIEKGLAGQYDFSISALLSEAWALVNGTKATFVGGMAIMYAIIFCLMMVFGLVSAVLIPMMSGSSDSANAAMGVAMILQGVSQIITMAITYPFTAAMILIGIRRSVGLPISFSMVFSCFNRIFSLLWLNILMMILVTIGFILLVIPGIYLLVCYTMAMPLLVEKNMSVWQALETSRKAVTKKWFKVFGLFFVIMLITMVSTIPLGIGLIWTLPLSFIAVGILYREMFGVEASA